MTTRDSLSPHLRAAAAAILAHREAIRVTWESLLDLHPQEKAAQQAISEQLDACIVSFAGYLLGEDPSISSMADRWWDMGPTREQAADAAVALGLFAETLRRSLARVPGLRVDVARLVPAASEFARDVLGAIFVREGAGTSERDWTRVVEVLARVRRRRMARVSALTDIAHAVSTTQNPDDLFEQVHAACSRIFNGDDFSISLYDAATRAVVPHLLYVGGARRHDLEGQALGSSLHWVVAETQQPLAVADYLAACAEHGAVPEPAYAANGARPWMAAPMVQGDQTIGVIAVFSPLLPFDWEDVEILAGIARHTAVALENSRLLRQQQRRTEQLRAVNQLARRLAALRDPDTLLSTAVVLIHQLLGYSAVSLFLVDDAGDTVSLRAHSNPETARQLLGLRFPIGAQGPGIVAAVAASGQAAVVADVSQDPRYVGTPATADTRSETAVPILREGQVLGVLDVQSTRLNAFDADDLTTLSTIADQLAIALENARLFHEEHERSRALALMLATTRAAGSSLVLDEVLERLAEGLAEAAGVSNCAIYLLDEDGQTLMPTAIATGPRTSFDCGRLRGTVLRVDESPTIRSVLAQREPFSCCRLPQDSRDDPVLERLLAGGCGLAVPLAAKGRVLGLALVIAEQQCDEFTPDRIQLIRGVADSAGLAVENARLYARTHGLAIAEERGRLAQEIHDTLAQGLTAISLHLDLADAYLPHKPEQASEKVRRALELTRANLEEVRRSVLDLRAARLHQMSLRDALWRLVQSFAAETGIDAEFTAEGLTGRLSARVEIGLYRIAEEALCNVRRHAGARHVRVGLTAAAGQVSLTVEDDGVGFAHEDVGRDNGGGFGLMSIRERARLLRGTLDLSSVPGAGTRLVVTIPAEGVLHATPVGKNEDTTA
ncbi:MAG: GAF domain-containing sensor histidine kinase [Sphaerobacter sp.]|nr:GAF domain-containing sensor histidine kinase [Sphaerobacter sp.]